MKNIIIKSWICDKIREDMKKYHLAPVWGLKEFGEYYVDEAGNCIVRGKVIKESEKAVQVELETETRIGMNLTGKTWTTWIPKSQLVGIVD